jgi:peptidase C25-like protein/flagellar hook capping protein FlgD
VPPVLDHRTVSRRGFRATTAAFVLLAAAGVLPAGASAGPAGVRLLPSTSGSVRLVVDVPAPRLEPVAEGPAPVRLVLDGYECVSPPGRPALPQRVLSVAVPAAGKVSVNVSAAMRDLREAVTLARTPVMPRGSNESLTEAGARTEALAALGEPEGSPRGPTPGLRARLLDVSWMRNQRVARILVTPADYDPTTRRLSVDRRIDVEVAVTGGGGASANGLAPAAAEVADPFEDLYRGVLVNYEQGRAWRRSAPARRQSHALGSFPDERDARTARVSATTSVPDTSVFAGREWIKIAIIRTGFYKILFRDLRTLPLFGNSTTTPLDSMRLFTWPGVPVLPEKSYCDSCDYREVAMGFVETVGKLNGIFDDNDEYLYFFALGPSDWASAYDRSQPDTLFIDHPYETRNYYYLTIATPEVPVGNVPRRITTESGAGPPTGGEVTPATFQARLHHEEDLQYWPDPYPGESNLFWEKWFEQTVEEPGSPTYTLPPVEAPGVDTTQASRLRMRCWGVTDLVFRSGHIYDHYLDVTFNALLFPRRGWYDQWAQTYDTTLVGLVRPSNTLTLQVPHVTDPVPAYDAQRRDRTALAWFDLFYARRFEPVGNELTFDSSPAGGVYRYDIGPFTLGVGKPPRIFDVTDPIAPVEILGATYANGGAGFRLTFLQTETGSHRYRVIPDSLEAIRSPNLFMAPSSSVDNLRAAPRPDQTGADYLVIYYDGFKVAADSLAGWRQARLPLHGVEPPYQTASIPISALYDQFSGGRTDPGAVRNFLRAAFFNWEKPPAFVTLLGDASYDFKNILGYAPEGLPGTLLPAYEGSYDPQAKRQYATDDWMLNVNDSVTVIPDFFGGRIPAVDASSALSFVRDKLLPFERRAPFGEWRNRVMLIADDHEQGDRPDFLRWHHVEQTAVLDTQELPGHVDRVYVYLHTYPDGPNNTKPGAKADILAHLNGDGVVMWNYIGHGSPAQIADESVFLAQDAGRLTNASKPNVFVAASCDVGKYHDPKVQSLGELLIMNPTAGCVAVLSATELASSFDNAELNRVLYDAMVRRDTMPTSPTLGQFHTSVSEALLEAKTGATNSQKYQVMGDAGTRLPLPRLWADVALKGAGGNPIDTLRRGDIVRFEGRILDRPGGVVVPFTGSAAMLVEDSAPIDTTFACDFCDRVTYPFRAAPIFRGDARATNGLFAGQFVVPLDAALGPRARARGYVTGSEAGTALAIDGAGSVSFVLVSGGPPGGDNEGPRIALSFAGGSTSVRPDAQLRIDLFDEHGILITGHTIQNGIIVTVDGNSNTRADVTSTFRYSANSYQAGTASFRLPGLAPGSHNIRVSAADNLASGINAAQHRSSASIDFEVRVTPTLAVQRAFLFPNPTRSGGPGSGGQFVIDAPGDPINVLLHIYTVSGRTIRTLRSLGGQGQVQIPWDGLDAEGERLANGTYLFKVQVNARDADGSSSPRSRAVAEGRIVVVGR